MVVKNGIFMTMVLNVHSHADKQRQCSKVATVGRRVGISSFMTLIRIIIKPSDVLSGHEHECPIIK